MIVASCPACRENVTVPIDARPTSIVRCPLCSAEYRLEEFLAQLPPPLIVLPEPDMATAEGTAAATDPVFVNEAASDSDVVIDFGRAEESGEQVPAFDFAPATEETATSSREVSRRPARRPSNPVWEVTKIVGGALLAVPAAQIILWWCVPYDWKRDLLGIGPAVSRVVPWVVPAKFHASNESDPSDAARVAPDDNTVAAVERRRENNGSGWRSSLPPLKDDRFKQPERRERAPATSGKTPEVVTDKVAGQSARTPPAAQPPSEPAVDADANAPDTAAMPDAPRVPGEPAAAHLPHYSAADLQKALEQALQASVAWDMSPDQTPEDRGELAEEFYCAFAYLGETLAFMTPGDPNAKDLAAAVSDLLTSLERQPNKLALIGNRTATWLDQPALPNQGIFLFGTVSQIQPQGTLFVTELELGSLQKRTVNILSPVDPQGFYAPGDRILMLGALIRDPAQNLQGYQGSETRVVLGSFPIRLR